MAKTLIERFDTLLKKAKLSNKVSKQALMEASEAWRAYKERPTDLRCPHDLADILAKLDIVLNQVAWKETRIEPTQWHAFCDLHTTIANALKTGQPLEPHDKGDKPCQSANDNSIAAALDKAINQSVKRNELKAVA